MRPSLPDALAQLEAATPANPGSRDAVAVPPDAVRVVVEHAAAQLAADDAKRLRDLAFKSVWTGIAAALAFVAMVAADLPTWWAPILTTVATAGLVVARQRAGQAPPTT